MNVETSTCKICQKPLENQNSPYCEACRTRLIAETEQNPSDKTSYETTLNLLELGAFLSILGLIILLVSFTMDITTGSGAQLDANEMALRNLWVIFGTGIIVSSIICFVGGVINKSIQELKPSDE